MSASAAAVSVATLFDSLVVLSYVQVNLVKQIMLDLTEPQQLLLIIISLKVIVYFLTQLPDPVILVDNVGS